MGFKFAYLCDLFSALEENRVLKASTEARKCDPDARAISHWFYQHGKRLRAPDTNQLALLSCMFPEKRPDRVYWLQDTSLARVIGRCLLLGSSRREELERWRTSGGVDLAQCVENVMRQAENYITADQEVTVEEVDAALNAIASRCRFSGPRVRRQRTAVDVEEALSPLYRRLSSRDAKWLTRMILKSLAPVVLPSRIVMKNFHFLLPHLLLFQDSMEAALNILHAGPISKFPSHPEPGLARDLSSIAMQNLDPMVGVKIGRPEYYKARSIKHCCQMVGRRRMSVERKYDGEYCQIHIDLTKRSDSIQIFSKSGKDSSADRAGINPVIREALRIGTPHCKFSRRCILEGEILVWSDKQDGIADFHKLRKFLPRSGTLIGTQNDSPPQPFEHLMIILFDILVLDDDICLKKPHRVRRLLLKDTVNVIHGRADIAQQWVLDFSPSDAPSRLEAIFTRGVTERWEGFVLKGCEDPYFSIFTGERNDSAGRWIKLKKDYIPGLGDTVDLALIGGAYKSRDAMSLAQHRKLLWTHFFIGCLVNKDAVQQSGAVPRFKVVGVIDQHGMSEKSMQILNQFGEFSACSIDAGHGFAIENLPTNLPAMDVVFKTPFVVEMLGSGFEKPSGARFFCLRFPRIQKIHWDRSFEDAATFSELQLLAEKARAVPEDDLQEESEWQSRLQRGAGTREYRISQSQSLNSTTATSQSDRTANETLPGTLESVSSVKSSERSHGLSGSEAGPPRRSSHGDPASRTVPIYVDESTDSMSSSDDEVRGNYLTTNDNLSSHRNVRKRKRPDDESCASSLKCTKTGDLSEDIESSSSLVPTGIASHLPAQSPLNDQRNGKKTIDPTSIAHAPPTRFTQPLTPTLSLQNMEVKTSEKKIPNVSLLMSDMDTFFQALGSKDESNQGKASNRQTDSQSITLGFITSDALQRLGPLILEIANRIYERTKKEPLRYPGGKIFVINPQLLQFLSNVDHSRSRLRHDWTNKGKGYFYACISWGPGKTASAGAAADEIPCTPYTSTIGKNGGARTPKIVVSFDRNEMDCLGELCSVQPGVHTRDTKHNETTNKD